MSMKFTRAALILTLPVALALVTTARADGQTEKKADGTTKTVTTTKSGNTTNGSAGSP